MNIPTEDFVSDPFKIAEMRPEPDMFIGSDGNDIGTVHVSYINLETGGDS